MNDWSKRQRFGATNKMIKIDKALSAEQKKQYLTYRNGDGSKAATEEAAGLSGVPVRQVQEDLVRDRALNIGSRPRWRVTASFIRHPPPLAGCWKGQAPPPRSRGQGRGVCRPPP